MFLRLPLLLWRKLFKTSSVDRHWSKSSERGSILGIRALIFCYKLAGKRAAGICLYPIVAYFFLFGRKARLASRDYLRRVHALDAIPKPDWKAGFKHMLVFAQSGLEKFSAWAGDSNNEVIDFPNQEVLDRILSSGRGAVLIGSHLGNLELSRALATENSDTIINAVVYTEHAQRFNQILTEANKRFNINLIQVADFGVDTAILFQEKIDRGELIVIVGDRTPPAENGRICYANFLGGSAAFAQGPLILASLLACPVYLLFCLRENEKYRIYFEHFAEHIKLPRHARESSLQTYIQRYADRLQVYCLKAPYQWFNFYNFWQK
tara:strand:+ start:27 stop:992 length:966 start_codon:yes stop_codon:yes gene_type:complete